MILIKIYVEFSCPSQCTRTRLPIDFFTYLYDLTYKTYLLPFHRDQQAKITLRVV